MKMSVGGNIVDDTGDERSMIAGLKIVDLRTISQWILIAVEWQQDPGFAGALDIQSCLKGLGNIMSCAHRNGINWRDRIKYNHVNLMPITTAILREHIFDGV